MLVEIARVVLLAGLAANRLANGWAIFTSKPVQSKRIAWILLVNHLQSIFLILGNIDQSHS